jgi:4-amino-4-deoxy-L-arabinose transferase-like glycosyltransferase
MIIFGVRLFLFLFLPLLLSGGILLLDHSTSTRERRLEVPLIFLFGLGVAASGIASFIGHFFFSDIVTDSVGWAQGSPFQLEIAFANLGVGLLGIVATARRDGFREATVIVVTVLGVGASIVHFMDILATGNMAPGNTVQNIANLVKPAFLIPLLIASRRSERSKDSDANTPQFEAWRIPLLQSVAFSTGIVSTAFGVGYAIGQPLLVSIIGTSVAVVITAILLARSPTHKTPSKTPFTQVS